MLCILTIHNYFLQYGQLYGNDDNEKTKKKVETPGVSTLLRAHAHDIVAL